MAFLTVNGVRLAYSDEGSGAPLLLVHGSWTNRHSWDLVAPKLARTFRVIRHDRRGHSESEDAPGTLDDDARDIAALIDQLDLGPAHLACSSRGGVVGLKLAASRPDLVRSLYCHEPPVLEVLPPEAREGAPTEVEARVVDLIESGRTEEAAKLFVEEAAFGPGWWDRMPRYLKGVFVENAQTFVEEFRDPEVHRIDIEALAAFPGPVLLSTSEDSPPWFAQVVDRLAAELPRVERHTYPAGGHNPQGQRPQKYVEVLSRFIGQGPRP